MAKKAKQTKDDTAGTISAEKLKASVAEYNRERAAASEHQGNAGQAIKQLADEHHLNMKAFRFVLGLSHMEETKRQAVLRGLIELSDKMEFFDSIDAFDDLIGTMEEVCQRAREVDDSAPRKGPDEAVSRLMN